MYLAANRMGGPTAYCLFSITFIEIEILGCMGTPRCEGVDLMMSSRSILCSGNFGNHDQSTHNLLCDEANFLSCRLLRGSACLWDLFGRGTHAQPVQQSNSVHACGTQQRAQLRQNVIKQGGISNNIIFHTVRLISPQMKLMIMPGPVFTL